jgi:hypothetical protein
MDESRRPLSDNISFVPTSVPETPSTSMRLYVRAFHAFVAFVRACVLIFCTLRIQVTRLRSLDTNHLRPGRMYLTHRTETETTWPTCKYRGHLDITACPLFDFTSPFDFFCVGLREPGFTVFSGIYYVMGMIPTVTLASLSDGTVHFSILTNSGLLGVITNSPFVRMGLRRTCILLIGHYHYEALLRVNGFLGLGVV